MPVENQDAQRFRQIVVPHLGDALGLARWLTGNMTDAEDVVQETCLRALKGISTYSGGSSKAWVLSITRNTCFTWLAKHRPKTLVLTDDPASVEQASGFRSDEAPTPEAQLIAKADEELVSSAIGKLPHLSREIVVLRDVNGLSYREIAEMLAIPTGTVMSRLARARALLAQELGVSHGK